MHQFVFRLLKVKDHIVFQRFKVHWTLRPEADDNYAIHTINGNNMFVHFLNLVLYHELTVLNFEKFWR